MRIEQTETEDEDAQAAIFRAIDAFNDAVSGRPEPGRKLAVPLPGGGGMFGYSYYDWLHLQVLAVPPGLRRRGLGTRALRAAEADAARNGCRGAWTETGPDGAAFLLRRGWAEFGRLADGPAEVDRVFVRRGLRPGAPGDLPVTDDISPEGFAAIEAAAPAPARHPLGLLLRDGQGAVEGGLWGWSEQGRMFVQLLFLPERLRRGGLGSELVGRASAVARRRGDRVIWLDTFSFQARPFYERLGFAVFARLEDYPPGHTRFFLAKRLDAPAGSAEKAGPPRSPV